MSGSEVVRALACVHDKIEVPSQWKRAVDSLRRMSNMEIGLAWVDTSNYAKGIGDIIIHSQYKTLFKQAVKEAKQDEENIASMKCCHKGNSSDTTEIIKLINEIRLLIQLNNEVRAPEPSLMPAAQTTPYPFAPETHDILSTTNSTHSTRAAPADPGVAAHPLPSLNMEAMQQMIETCCTENRASVEKLQAVVERTNAEMNDMKANQLKQMVSSSTFYTTVTESTQVQEKVSLKLDNLAAQMTDGRLQKEMQQAIEEYTTRAEATQAERVAELLEPKIISVVQSNIDALKNTLAEEFTEQTTGILSHDASTTRVVERIEGTLQAILNILGSRERSGQNLIQSTTAALQGIRDIVERTGIERAEMKEAIDQNLTTTAANHNALLTRLSGVVREALDTIVEMLQTLMSIEKANRRSVNRGSAASEQDESVDEEDPIGNAYGVASRGTATDAKPQEESEVRTNTNNDTEIRNAIRLTDPRTVRKVHRLRTRRMNFKDSPLSEDQLRPGYISQAAHKAENTGKMRPSP